MTDIVIVNLIIELLDYDLKDKIKKKYDFVLFV